MAEVVLLPYVVDPVDALDVEGIDSRSSRKAAVDLSNGLLLAEWMRQVVVKFAVGRGVWIIDDPDCPSF